jgi:hypothetical protein
LGEPAADRQARLYALALAEPRSVSSLAGDDPFRMKQALGIERRSGREGPAPDG